MGESTASKCKQDAPPFASSAHYFDERSACDAIVLATLLKALVKAGLYPLPEPSAYSKSASALRFELDAVRMSLGCLSPVPGASSRHSTCSPSESLRKAVEAAWTAPRYIITDQHKAHLALQASKSGILRAPELHALQPNSPKVGQGASVFPFSRPSAPSSASTVVVRGPAT